jgi:cysteine desulfuration protein SufE
VNGTDIAQVQTDLIEEFELFDNWLDRYEYIIDLGRKLPAFPDDCKTEDYRLHGCQSQVWLRANELDGHLHFQAISDSAIVSGLIAVLLRVYSDRSPQEIIATQPDFITAIGLDSHLSPTRSNGLQAMIDAIRGHAIQCAG